MDNNQLLAKAQQVIAIQEELLDDVPLFGFESEKAEWLYEIGTEAHNRLNHFGDCLDHVDPNSTEPEILAYVEELEADYGLVEKTMEIVRR